MLEFYVVSALLIVVSYCLGGMTMYRRYYSGVSKTLDALKVQRQPNASIGMELWYILWSTLRRSKAMHRRAQRAEGKLWRTEAKLKEARFQISLRNEIIEASWFALPPDSKDHSLNPDGTWNLLNGVIHLAGKTGHYQPDEPDYSDTELGKPWDDFSKMQQEVEKALYRKPAPRLIMSDAAAAKFGHTQESLVRFQEVSAQITGPDGQLDSKKYQELLESAKTPSERQQYKNWFFGHLYGARHEAAVKNLMSDIAKEAGPPSGK